MTVITIRVPDSKENMVSSFVKDIGGEVISPEKQTEVTADEDEVTHEVFFGENIKRLIKAFN